MFRALRALTDGTPLRASKEPRTIPAGPRRRFAASRTTTLGGSVLEESKTDLGLNLTFMYEVLYATNRVARVAASDRELAKRRFAAYVLYDDDEHIAFDVQLSFGDEAEVAPFENDAPVTGAREDVHRWLSRRDEQTEPFEVSLFEDSERSLDAFLRLLATNDPWRLEGHSSLGRRLSAVDVTAELVTFDGRITRCFDAARFLDYVRFDVIEALDPERPQDSIRIESLVDVAALEDDVLRQIVSSYETIANEYRLTAKYSSGPPVERAFSVTLSRGSWQAYLDHRRAEPDRFLPPPGWTSPFPSYES